MWKTAISDTYYTAWFPSSSPVNIHMKSWTQPPPFRHFVVDVHSSFIVFSILVRSLCVADVCVIDISCQRRRSHRNYLWTNLHRVTLHRIAHLTISQLPFACHQNDAPPYAKWRVSSVSVHKRCQQQTQEIAVSTLNVGNIGVCMQTALCQANSDPLNISIGNNWWNYCAVNIWMIV